MTLRMHMTIAVFLAVSAFQAHAQNSDISGSNPAFEHARLIKIGYDGAHLAHSLQYHQARTMLALIGGYTRYDYCERITENNWFFSQIEELELQLPRMRRSAERLRVSEENRLNLDTLFDELETLLGASRKVHAAIKGGDLEEANRLYNEVIDVPYNAAVGAAHTLISNNDKAITMIRLREK